MASILNFSFIDDYPSSGTVTITQASGTNRALVLMVYATDLYGNDNNTGLVFNGSTLIPTHTYDYSATASNNSCSVYVLLNSQLPAAGTYSIATQTNGWKTILMYEIQEANQTLADWTFAAYNMLSTNNFYNNITSLAMTLNVYTAFLPTGYLYTPTADTTEVYNAAEGNGVLCVGTWTPSNDATASVGFDAEYGVYGGLVVMFGAAVINVAVDFNPSETYTAPTQERGSLFIGNEWDIRPTEFAIAPLTSAFGFDISDAGVLADVVDPNGDAISGEIYVAPTQGIVQMTPSGNIYYYPDNELVEGDTFTVRPWSDGNPSTDTFDVSISFDEFAVAPVFSSSPVTTVSEGSTYTYNGTVSDANGDSVTIEALAKPSWATFTQTGPYTFTLTGNPTSEQIYSYSVNLRVSDGFLNATQSYSIAVTRAPFITSSLTINANNWQQSTYQITTTEPSATFAGVGLPSGVTVSSSGLVTMDFTNGGTFNIIVDMTANGLTRQATIVATVNAKPVFYTNPSQTVAIGTIDPITVEAKDPEGQVLTLTGISIPSGLAFVPITEPQTTANGLVYTGVITGNLTQGVHTVVIRAVAANSGGTTDFTMTLSNTASAPIVVTQPTNQSVSVGQNATFVAEFSGATSYQWYIAAGNVPISGATSSTYIRTATSLDDGLAIYCRGTNTNGYIDTNTVVLDVLAVATKITIPHLITVTGTSRGGQAIPTKIFTESGTLIIDTTITMNSVGTTTFTSNFLGDVGDLVQVEFHNTIDSTWSGIMLTVEGV